MIAKCATAQFEIRRHFGDDQQIGCVETNHDFSRP